MLANLTSNAVKFTDAGGEVAVRVCCEAKEDGARNVVMRVRDTGIGIPKEAQELIFERFRQENMSTVRRYGGSGLGLSLVKDLVAMMGGTVAVSSEPGCGSTFAVELPAEEEDHD